MKRILVVDDEFAIAQLIKLNLEKQGFAVDTAFTGAEAIEKIRANKPDIITLDILMPEMNGFQVLELLKTDSQTKDIPVILVSIISGLQKERGFRLGAVDFISKPIEFDKLFKSIEKFGSQLSGVKEKRKKILVVDDEPDTAKLVQRSLEDKGLQVFVANDGPEGFNLAKQEHPDLIVLDLYMPDMNGFSLIKILKTDTNTEDIPIIVLTGQDMKGFREKCIMLGASDYLTKPFSAEVLVQEIRKYLQ